MGQSHTDEWRIAVSVLTIVALTVLTRRNFGLPTRTEAAQPTDPPLPSRADWPPDDPRGIATPGHW